MRALPLLALAAVAGALLAGCFQSGGKDARPMADLVLRGGVIWTGESDPAWAEAVAIEGDHVVALGSDASVSRFIGDGTRVVELGGAFVSPGWRDHHVHVLGLMDESPGAASAQLRPEPFVESELQAEVRHEQDFAYQLAYHGSRSADAAIDEDGRNFGPASLYEDCGEPVVGEGGITPPTEANLEALMAIEAELASQGITSVVEAQLRNMTHVLALLELQERGLSKIRWQLRVVPGCYEMLDSLGMEAQVDEPWVRLLGVKLYADGYLGGWIASLRAPYSDRPFWTGVSTYDADTFLYRVDEAARRGLTVGTHAIGDYSAEQALDAYEAAGVTADHRWTVEHAQVLGPDLVERMAEDGVIASIQYSFATTDQHFAEDRLGPERLEWAYAWKALAGSGIVLAGGSDYPIEVITPLWGLQRVVTRAELDGSAPWLPEQALTVEQALRGITWGTAYAANEDAQRGTLAVGKKADLTILRENPFEVDPNELAAGTVLMTITNGNFTFEGEQSYPPPDPWPEPPAGWEGRHGHDDELRPAAGEEAMGHGHDIR